MILFLIFPTTFSTSCTVTYELNTTLFISQYAHSDENFCINSRSKNWVIFVNEGTESVDVTIPYSTRSGTVKKKKESKKFSAFLISNSQNDSPSSAVIQPLELTYLSFSAVVFDDDCEVGIASNFETDEISKSDFEIPNPIYVKSATKKLNERNAIQTVISLYQGINFIDAVKSGLEDIKNIDSLFENKNSHVKNSNLASKICYFNGINFRSYLAREKVTSSLIQIRNWENDLENWTTPEFKTTGIHPSMIKIPVSDSETPIEILTNYSVKYNQARIKISLKSNNLNTFEISGTTYDPLFCTNKHDYDREISEIASLNNVIVSLAFFFFLMPIICIITYCFCCPCCCCYKPQCLKPFGLILEDDEKRKQLNEHLNQNMNENETKEPIYLVYQQHIPAAGLPVEMPEVVPTVVPTVIPNPEEGTDTVLATNYPPPGVYEPVRLQAPTVQITINE
ncbi:hypothetical protein TRFO_29274 [Tritrichomonas foetus]|uniref:Uncharacterized protein n=1 Tax=Tritrichomonas foetus TaxID=1144522 RepID=A0A1J4JW37_9EUKA|nr:hypothetical protein TRFO_29274 [Tritrichomonas foetus]|eukprot:OHT03353.1 hypothetical protein TRFO_29274 [Tritrichomonas foetus]